MNREINFELSSIDDIYISSEIYNGDYKEGLKLFAGFEGENEATKLSFSFCADFDDYTVTLLLSGDDLEEVEVSLTDDEYLIPDEYMIPEIVYMKIKATNGTQVLYSPDIQLRIKY